MRVSAAALRLLIVTIFVVALAGCGFRLAGSGNLPQNLTSIHLQTKGFSDQQRNALKQRLGRAGALFKNESVTGVTTLIVIFKELTTRRLVSSASDGRTVERLTRSLIFSLKSNSGDEITPAKTLVQQKDIIFNDDNLLASSQEKASVVKNLEQALFNRLIGQLQRI